MPEFTTKIRERRHQYVSLLIVLMLLTVVPISAQDASRVLAPGSTLIGSLGPDNTATSYVFDAAVGSSAMLSAESRTGAELGLLLSDSNGNVIASAVHSTSSGSTAIENALLSTGGRYFVVVYFAPGTSATQTSFDIFLDVFQADESADGEAAPAEGSAAQDAPSLVLIAAGIEVQLSWSGDADMNLQVRDPSGETLYWDSRSTVNGGEFGFDANGLCQVISPNPVETATWQPGFLSTGSYEVLVFYREACNSSVGSVPFSVRVTVDGALSGAINGVLSPPPQGQESVYVSRFEVESDATATVSSGDVYPNSSLTRLPVGFDIASNIPSSVSRDIPVAGVISNETPFLTYAFAGTTGEVISVSMQAQGPNLDTFLQIVDGSGAVVNINDDALGTTDSLISNARLLNSGTYTIIATRYGKELGGTEGQFQLTLSGPADDVPQALTGLELPQGDIGVTLLWGTGADLQLLVRDPIGGAVFDDIPFGSSGGILQEFGNVNCIPAASAAPVSYIYWPPGRMRPGTYEVEVWYQNACVAVPPAVEFTLAIEVLGETIAVERQFPLVNQRFVTNFTILPDGTAIRGEGGFIDGGSNNLPYRPEVIDAPTIVSGETVTGTISPSKTFDVYSFQGVAGETVTISMSAATQVLDTNLYLISPSGIEIAANDDGDPVSLGTSGRPTDSIISGVVLPENGPYTIIATRFATRFGGTIGNYSLTLEKN